MPHLAQRAGAVQAQPPGAAREELLNLALQLAPQPAWRLARGGAEAQRLGQVRTGVRARLRARVRLVGGGVAPRRSAWCTKKKRRSKPRSQLRRVRGEG